MLCINQVFETTYSEVGKSGASISFVFRFASWFRKKKGIEKIAGGSYICHLYKLIYNLNVISSVFTSFSNINMNIHECYFIES